jgi:UDP-xylose/UDP-N-acetylglucosamine transporter B4
MSKTVEKSIVGSISKQPTNSSLNNANIVTKSILQTTTAHWAFILLLIFGGCCSNVFMLEALVNRHSNGSGQLLTFIQFLFVSLQGFYHFLDIKNSNIKRLFLAKPKVPLKKWALPVSLFFAVSMLNNLAVWGYSISVPAHIIIRSGGTVTTMIAGYLVAGKRYKLLQVFSVLILTAGVILATLDNSPKDNKPTREGDGTFSLGVTFLFIAAVLSSIMGLVCEKVYKEYGKHWEENLFYTHFMSLPLFIPFLPEIFIQLRGIANSSPRISIPFTSWTTSEALLYLILNAFTQYICVRGVNNLAGHASALTVSIVLNVRKFCSLLLSIYLFGNELSGGTIVGTLLVSIGASLYSYSNSRPTRVDPEKKTK